MGTVIINGEIKPWRKNGDGYVVCSVFTEDGYRSVAIHRLVALAFIDNPNNYPEVNHKDFNRENPCVENLEWISHKDNVTYSRNAGRYKPRYGADNGNYGNHKLSEIYKQNPEYCMKKQSRPGLRNGRCVKIDLFDNEHNLVKTFQYIVECIKYIKEKENLSANVESIRGQISRVIREGKSYRGYYFKKYN